MQYRKCVALCAAMLVGFGVVTADAATVSSVTITSPDSGALKGIDSTFVVTAVVSDLSPDVADAVYFYLVRAGHADSVVADVGSAVFSGISSAGNVTTLRDENLVTAFVNNAAGFISAKIVRTATPTVTGDADSITVTAGGASTTYTWYGKVHHSSGTVGGLRAAVVAEDWDPNGPDTWSAAKISPANKRFDIDADRPPNPVRMVHPVAKTAITTAAGGYGITGFNKTGSSNVAFSGIPTTGTAYILGIGDSLNMDIKLGSSTGSGVLNGDTLNVVATLFGKVFPVSKSPASFDTLKFRHAIAETEFGDVVGDRAATTSTLSVFVVDLAGNRSSTTDATITGVTTAANYFVDAKKPVLDNGVAAGDTILPVANDTLTDGGVNTALDYAGNAISNDLNALTYNLGEALDSLFITIGTTKLTIANDTQSMANASLLAGAERRIDFTSVGADSTSETGDSVVVANAAGVRQQSYGTAVGAGGFVLSNAISGDSTIATGVQSIVFQGMDLAGNLGPALTRTGVYVDVDDISLDRLFPTAASSLDTLEEETSKVVFRLTEHADSVLITYTGIAGVDNAVTRSRALAGGELLDIVNEQKFNFNANGSLDSLRSNTQYVLQIVAADLAGNYTQTSVDTFVYDTTFVVPVINTFKIITSNTAPLAGDTVTLTLQARTATDAAAVTYQLASVLKISGGTGITIAGTGVDTEALPTGRANLSADDWIVGERVVTIVDTSSTESLVVTVQDCSDVNNLFVQTSTDTIVYSPNVYSQIALSAADEVGQGDNFWVGVTLADKYGNARTKDSRYVQVSTNALGVQLPSSAIQIAAGTGGFWANSQGYAGDLTLNVRDIVDTLAAGTPTANGNEFMQASITVSVNGDGAVVLDAPDTVSAVDYKGALGAGDQGGFVLLTFPVSEDHSTLTGYRIYREVMVGTGLDPASGGLVDLSLPHVATPIPWGRVDAVPGTDIMYVVIATLDGDLTRYGVAAERGNLTTKEAFVAAEAISTPYELMAETMQQSKEVAQIGPTAPVFATLTPEALAFSSNGIVPRLKTIEGTLLSNIRNSEPVRAIDNIAPAAVSYMKTQDTPGDAGGSITVQWAKSADDKMLTTTVPNAVGAFNTYTTAGVEGYNVYRKLGDAAWQMVGQTGAGETSFEDATVFNGVRYSYKVEAHDADNVTTSQFEKSAMAIRNNVVDADGQRILGLFGTDNRVDYDDFFIFADHFGLTAGSETFDSAFDLSPNNAVDFDDFFLFADNFGRQMAGIGKVVPTMTGLNSDARFYLSAGTELPEVGAELSVGVSLEDFVEVRAYGLTVEFDNELLEFVETRVVDNILGETDLATPRVFAQADGKVEIAALGNTASDGDLGLNLIFRAKQEIEDSYIEFTNGTVQDGTYGLNRITTPMSVRIETRPEAYALHENYPNPFNPETTIKYQLPEAGQVRLEVYNMLGQVVKTLVDNQFQNAGRYTLQWDATNNSGQPLSSGVYFYRVLAGGEFQSHKKMLLLK